LHPLSIRNAQRAPGLEQGILADSVIILGFRRGTEQHHAVQSSIPDKLAWLLVQDLRWRLANNRENIGAVVLTTVNASQIKHNAMKTSTQKTLRFYCSTTKLQVDVSPMQHPLKREIECAFGRSLGALAHLAATPTQATHAFFPPLHKSVSACTKRFKCMIADQHMQAIAK
jgi:hypothetical protein